MTVSNMHKVLYATHVTDKHQTASLCSIIIIIFSISYSK